MKLHVLDLALSTIWKLSHISSLSQRSFLISLYNIIACRYIHIFSGRARFARLCISVCVRRWEFSLGMQVLQAFADASFMLFFSFSVSPGIALRYLLLFLYVFYWVCDPTKSSSNKDNSVCLQRLIARHFIYSRLTFESMTVCCGFLDWERQAEHLQGCNLWLFSKIKFGGNFDII